MNRRSFFWTVGGSSLALTAEASAEQVGVATRITQSAVQQGFGGAILVEQKGKIVYERLFRHANIPFDVPNKADTRFRIASVTKLFTAVMVMQLVERGRLSLSDTLSARLPNYRGDGGGRITLYHMLTATSGLRDFGGSDEEAYKTPWTEEEIVNRFCSGDLDFAPGSKFNYNNADYFLLGKIMEQTTGQSFQAELATRILRPLHLNDTGMAHDSHIIPRLATPYARSKEAGLSNEPHLYIQNYGAAGAMYSTARDLMVFSQALYQGKLISPDTLVKLLTPYLANYAMGLWMFDRTLGGKTIRMAERQGSIGATGARLVRLLDYDATIVLLANIWPENMDGLLRDIVVELVG